VRLSGRLSSLVVCTGNDIGSGLGLQWAEWSGYHLIALPVTLTLKQNPRFSFDRGR
jgi:hypothetical protein